MSELPDALLLARIQFAFTVSFHFLFPAITIATNIKSFNHTFASGTQTSSVKKYWTKAHGGKYWVWLDWRIVNG